MSLLFYGRRIEIDGQVRVFVVWQFSCNATNLLNYSASFVSCVDESEICLPNEMHAEISPEAWDSYIIHIFTDLNKA